MKWRISALVLTVLMIATQATIHAQTQGLASTATQFQNQDKTSLTSGSWIGNGAGASYAGFRFTGVSIPQGATITSANLIVYSVKQQWMSLALAWGADDVASSPAIATTANLSSRVQTTAQVNHSSNTQWQSNTFYMLDEISPVIQEVVNRSDWASGNALTVIARGTGNAWGRKFIAGSGANAPKLVVSYISGMSQIITATFTPTPQTNPNTPTPTNVPSATQTPTTVMPTATATAVAPTPTNVPSATNTPTVVAPTPTITAATPTATATATTAPIPIVPGVNTYIKVGTGYSDVSPHQIVRTSNDQLYLFGAQMYNSIIYAYWANGLPGSSTDFKSASVTASAVVISLDAVNINSTTIHVLANLQDGKIVDYPFNTTSNSFGPVSVLATNGRTVSGDYIGTGGIAGALDAGGTLHVVYQNNANHIIYRNTNTQLDSASAQHPAIAIAPDGSIVVAWLQTDGTIQTRTLNATTWGAVETASTAPAFTSTNAGLSIDQGPSLAIDANGVKHIAYIENWRTSAPYDYGRIHYARNSGTGWQDVYTGAYTHDPAIALNSAGEVYIIGHGHPLNPTCSSIDDLCLQKRNADGSWTAQQLFATHPTGASFDSSPSLKWSQSTWYRPETIEFVFFDSNVNPPILWYGRK